VPHKESWECQFTALTVNYMIFFFFFSFSLPITFQGIVCIIQKSLLLVTPVVIKWTAASNLLLVQDLFCYSLWRKKEVGNSDIGTIYTWSLHVFLLIGQLSDLSKRFHFNPISWPFIHILWGGIWQLVKYVWFIKKRTNSSEWGCTNLYVFC